MPYTDATEKFFNKTETFAGDRVGNRFYFLLTGFPPSTEVGVLTSDYALEFTTTTAGKGIHNP